LSSSRLPNATISFLMVNGEVIVESKLGVICPHVNNLEKYKKKLFGTIA
jgi:hypothetical protein